MATEQQGWLHLIAGSTGAGKTSFAKELCGTLGAVHLSIDDWMATLYGPDQPESPDFAWMLARTQRCEAVMWPLILQTVRLGVPVVADCGFTRRAHRASWRARAAGDGIATILHHLDVPAAVRWQRVERRNREKTASYRFEVTRPMFDFIEGLWEPPTPEELQPMHPTPDIAGTP